MIPYQRFLTLLALVLLCISLLCACASQGEPAAYDTGEHTHVYGKWCDAAPTEEGAAVTHEVRYCKICHAEETRSKE